MKTKVKTFVSTVFLFFFLNAIQFNQFFHICGNMLNKKVRLEMPHF